MTREADGPGLRPPGPSSTSSGEDAAGVSILPHATDGDAVAAKLRRLRDHHGYLTRSEIEEALGLPSPRGRWECPGEFGANGRWRLHCGTGAA